MSDLVGTLTFRMEGNTPSLTFTGPDFPASGINPTMTVLYNPNNRRVEFRVGLTTESDSISVDLANLPDDMQRLINNRGQNRKAQVSLTLPGCAALQNGSNFLTYEEYMQRVRGARAVSRPAGGSFNPLDPAMLRAAAAAVVYPPLPRAVFDRLVARCRGAQLFGR